MAHVLPRQLSVKFVPVSFLQLGWLNLNIGAESNRQYIQAYMIKDKKEDQPQKRKGFNLARNGNRREEIRAREQLGNKCTTSQYWSTSTLQRRLISRQKWPGSESAKMY